MPPMKKRPISFHLDPGLALTRRRRPMNLSGFEEDDSVICDSYASAEASDTIPQSFVFPESTGCTVHMSMSGGRGGSHRSMNQEMAFYSAAARQGLFLDYPWQLQAHWFAEEVHLMLETQISKEEPVIGPTSPYLDGVDERRCEVEFRYSELARIVNEVKVEDYSFAGKHIDALVLGFFDLQHALARLEPLLQLYLLELEVIPLMPRELEEYRRRTMKMGTAVNLVASAMKIARRKPGEAAELLDAARFAAMEAME